jgi:hypothetical protein
MVKEYREDLFGYTIPVIERGNPKDPPKNHHGGRCPIFHRFIGLSQHPIPVYRQAEKHISSPTTPLFPMKKNIIIVPILISFLLFFLISFKLHKNTQ